MSYFCGLLNSNHLTWIHFTFAKYALSVLNLIIIEKEEIIAKITKKKFQTIEIKSFCSRICIKNFKNLKKSSAKVNLNRELSPPDHFSLRWWKYF